MMNALIKSSLLTPKSSLFHIKSAFFHSTTFLERGRRNPWTERYNNNGNKNRKSGYRRNHFKHNLMRDANAYVEHLFESWQFDDHDDQPPKKGPSWFRQPQNGSRKNTSNTQGRQNKGKGHNFCQDDDDDDIESIFRTTFSDRFFFWSFVNEDYPHSRNSSRRSSRHKNSWKQRHQNEDEYDEYEYKYEYKSNRATKKSDLASERITLGLSASGPLKLEDVKSAYRSCALKWHPDRHLGSSKADAEEKFKHCTAAYQTLCDKMAVR